MSQKIINGYKKSIGVEDAGGMLGNAWLFQTASMPISNSVAGVKKFYIETPAASDSLVFIKDLDFRSYGTAVKTDLYISPHMSASYSTSYGPGAGVTSSFTSSVQSGSVLTPICLNGQASHARNFKLCANPVTSASNGTLVLTKMSTSGTLDQGSYLYGLKGSSTYIVTVADTVTGANTVPLANILIIDQFPYD